MPDTEYQVGDVVVNETGQSEPYQVGGQVIQETQTSTIVIPVVMAHLRQQGIS